MELNEVPLETILGDRKTWTAGNAGNAGNAGEHID